MGYLEFFSAMKLQAQSWGDLVARCYCEIEQLDVSQELFLSMCCFDVPDSAPTDAPRNPNLETLERLNDEVYAIVSDGLTYPETSNRSMEISRVCEIAQSVCLKDYPQVSQELNEAAVYWEVIASIDKAFESCFNHIEETCRGPINSPFEGDAGLGRRVFIQPE